jgi:phenylpropionate dioxygenase-like ring-hydroxylating dioxygenase large terminal subunit
MTTLTTNSHEIVADAETAAPQQQPAVQRSMREMLERVCKPPTEAWTLPPRAYADPSVYELEKQSVFRNQWLMAGRVEQIPNIGDYYTLDLFGRRLIVVRAGESQIRCFSRVCLHRGALLGNDGGGTCKTFVCPYHSWSFDLQGKLRSARDIEKARFAADEAQLPAVRTEIWQGCIFINFAPAAAPLGPQLGGLARFFDGYDLESMVLLPEYVEFDTRMNWKVLCENFMEAYHHPGPHLDLLQKPFPYTASYVLDNGGEPWSVLAMPNPAEQDQNLLPGIAGLQDWRRTGLVAAIIYPNTLLAFTGDIGIWYQIIPDTFDHFTLRIRTLVPSTSLQVPNFAGIAKTYRDEFLRPLHLQDEAINNNVWAGLTSAAARQGRLHPKYELALWQMNQWWCAQVGKHLVR